MTSPRAEFQIALLQAARRVAENYDIHIETDGDAVAVLVEALAVVSLAVAKTFSQEVTEVMVSCSEGRARKAMVAVKDGGEWFPILTEFSDTEETTH